MERAVGVIGAFVELNGNFALFFNIGLRVWLVG